MSLPTFTEFTLTLRLRIKELDSNIMGILNTPFTSLVELEKSFVTKTERLYVKEIVSENKTFLESLVADYNNMLSLKNKLEKLLLETSDEDYIQVILDNSYLTKSLEHLAHRINFSKLSTERVEL